MVATIRQRPLISFCAFLFVLAVCFAQARAEEVTAVFIAPTNSFVAGSRASVWLYLMNNSPGEVHRVLDAKLNGKFIAPPVSWDAVLNSVRQFPLPGSDHVLNSLVEQSPHIYGQCFSGGLPQVGQAALDWGERD